MRFLLLPLVAVLSSGAALAQEAPLSKVYACAGIARAEDRLACYDSAVAGLKSAEAAGGVAVVSQAQIAEATKQSFGLNRPAVTDMAKLAPGLKPMAEPPEVDSIKAGITSAEKKADGKYRFVLDNGQVWDQMESEKVWGINKLPVDAEINKTMIGNFMMKIDGARGIRVRRVS